MTRRALLSITSPEPFQAGFPYPRGNLPAYGAMSVDYAWAKANGFTLIHPHFYSSMTPSEFVSNINTAKSLGMEKNLVNHTGPEANTDSWWATVKSLGVTEDDFLGAFLLSEPTSTSQISVMYASLHKYFPKAVAGDYGVEWKSEYVPFLDIAYFTSYTKFHVRPHSFVYGNLLTNASRWTSAGKYIWLTTELFGAACAVNTSDPDLDTSQKVQDREISQIVMGILGGAKGVFAYAGAYGKGRPCGDGLVAFCSRYKEIWPWIMPGNRELLSTNVTSGIRTINCDGISSGTRIIPSVVAYKFTDSSGRVLIASSSMLDFTEAGGSANNATISGVPNGTYDVLWEGRTVTVSNGTISGTWQPYGYHFYQLR